jgi:enamine deaminase RidA (YjgF/YER057c/UK114 family)
LTTVVEAAGGKTGHVVRLSIYVKSRDDYVAKLKPLGEAYRRYFGGHYPAMALFEVSGFFQPDALVEIEGIAVLDDVSRP